MADIHPALRAELERELTGSVQHLLAGSAEHDGKDDVIEANVDLMNDLFNSPQPARRGDGLFVAPSAPPPITKRGLTVRSSNDQKPQAVESFDACESGDECPHCAAGRPEAPEAAGDPADLSSSTWEVETDAQRFALPPTYHRAVYLDTLSPPGWFCAACWGDSVLTGWPCVVATRHASYISRAIHEERQAVRPGHVREATFMDAGDAARKIGRPDGLGVCFGNDHGYCCPVTWLKQPDGNAVDPDDLAAYQAIVGTRPQATSGGDDR